MRPFQQVPCLHTHIYITHVYNMYIPKYVYKYADNEPCTIYYVYIIYECEMFVFVYSFYRQLKHRRR